jgi:hypothetical protein
MKCRHLETLGSGWEMRQGVLLMLHLGIATSRKLFLPVAVIAMVMACNMAVLGSPGDREYTNRQYGFVFRYPDVWHRQASTGSSPVIAFGEPHKTGFAASVNVVAVMQAGASASQYARNAASRISQGADARLSDYREDGQGSSGPVEGGDSWLMRFSCYSSDARSRIWFYQLTVVRGRDVIILTGACLESEKDTYLPVFEGIVSSFRLI